MGFLVLLFSFTTMRAHHPLEAVAAFIALLLLFCCAPGALSAAPTPTPSPSLVRPAATTAAACLEQPFEALSGAFSIGQGQAGVPSIVFTLGSSAELYATDVWGTVETPLSLRTNNVAHMAASNAQLRGAAYSGGSLYLVFARNNVLGQSSILQIDQPWGGSPSFKVEDFTPPQPTPYTASTSRCRGVRLKGGGVNSSTLWGRCECTTS
jgi:hypothetical protein